MNDPEPRHPTTGSDRGEAGPGSPPAAADYGRGRYPESSTVLHDDDGYDDFFGFEGRSRDYVRIPRRAPELPGFLSFGLLLKLGVLVALAATGLWGYHQVNPAGEPSQALVIEVPPGATTADIADVLDEAGVIGSSRLFQEYARFKSGGLIKAGSYTLYKDMALWEALDALTTGPVQEGFANLTVPEGLRLSELAPAMVSSMPRFTEEAVNNALSSGQVTSTYLPPGGTLEGLLFPDTYQVADSADEVAALQQMANQFDAVAAEVNLEARASAMGYTPYQIITIASMIEEEAKVAEERPKIARVIYNRLAEGMRLDIDATTLYAVGKQGNTLTLTDLDSDSPYNTRKMPGIPPGPISAPGRASLEAALNPVDGPWLFYVLSDENGTHAFTDSAEEFEGLVAEADAKGLLG